MRQRFRSDTFYPADPDPLNMDPPENIIQFEVSNWVRMFLKINSRIIKTY